MGNYIELLSDLRNRLIKLNGNDLVNKKLQPGGSGNVVNIIDEVPAFVVDTLLAGKKLVLQPLTAQEDYLEDEEDKTFQSAVARKIAESDLTESDLSEEDLRELKDQVRSELGMASSENYIPRKNYDLDTTVDPEQKKHVDNKLQTDVADERFKACLLKIRKAMLDYEREKGIDSCFLTVGFLKWTKEKDNAVKTYNSPIFLIPCEITEKNDKFSIETSGKDYGTNRILSPIFQQELGIDFPQYVERDEDENSGIYEYLREVDELVANIDRDGWEFQHRMAFGHFKSSGIPLQELDPGGYTEEQLALLGELIGEANPEMSGMPIHEIDSEDITRNVPYTVIPADSSQYSAVADVASGRNLVMEGPPGTGKSQTIVNIIANAIHHDKKVLFLAQKTAALNVVYERLRQCGLDQKSLAIHSEYSNKAALFEAVAKVAGSAAVDQTSQKAREAYFEAYDEYNKVKKELNRYSEFLSYTVCQTSITAQEVLTRYALCQSAEKPGLELNIDESLTDLDLAHAADNVERLQTLASSLGKETLCNLTVLERNEGFDPFALNDFKEALEQIINFLYEYMEYFSFESLEHQAEHLERKRKELKLAVELREKNAALDSEYVRSALPQRQELSELKRLLADANVFARLLLPKLYQARKTIQTITSSEIRGHDRMVESLSRLETIMDEIQSVEGALSQIKDHDSSIEELQQEVDYFEECYDQTQNILDCLGMWCGKDLGDLSISYILAQAELLYANMDKVNTLIEFYGIEKECTSKFTNMHHFIRACVENEIAMSTAFESAIYHRLAKNLSIGFPDYYKYTGDYIDTRRKRLASLTAKLDKLYCEYLSTKQPSPQPTGNKAVKVKEKKGTNLINHVVNTPRARLTVREFMSRAGGALQCYAPCFMMTPSSVAEFLNKDFLFDLVVIDEASQMLAEEAAGSILRSRQCVVVGDSQQMPPTAYMVSGLDVDPDEYDNKNESILERASVCFDTHRRLLYHYRSKHESLIQFSNAEFYDNELMVIPSQNWNENLGIKYVELDAMYNPAKNGDSANPNPVEAETVVEDICAFMRDPKNRNKSLGVAALNLRQSRRIDDMMLEKIYEDPDLREYIDRWKSTQEYFFVKNLENVQGDERDVIMIATVFGKDSNGKVPQRFGPINQNMGEKRINVLITRAKEQVVVYSSMMPNDITTHAVGAQVLRRFLIFAKNGILENTEFTDKTGTFDSPWEEWFYEKLSEDGFDVVPQVGVSGWRIDLGVKHESKSDGYICGIELDGAAYHSSRYARERDYLRQKVLESQGWNIIRVWSTDFFNNKEGVYQQLVQDIMNLLPET